MIAFLSSLSEADQLRVFWVAAGCVVGLLGWAMSEDSYGSQP